MVMVGFSSAQRRERTEAGRAWRSFAIEASEVADRLQDSEAEPWDCGCDPAPEPVGPRCAGAGLEAGAIADSGISTPLAGVGRPG